MSPDYRRSISLQPDAHMLKSPSGRSLTVTVPDGVAAGQFIELADPEGGENITVAVPDGLSAGEAFTIEINGTEGTADATSTVGTAGHKTPSTDRTLLPSTKKAQAQMLSDGKIKAAFNLFDDNEDGLLDADEFALAMWLCNHVAAGNACPGELAPEMVPPSKR